jgi:hypothetical protein
MKKMPFLAHINACFFDGSHLNHTSLCNNSKTIIRFKEKMQRIKAFILHVNKKKIIKYSVP